MISLPPSIGLGLGILYRLSERSALTGLLPDFSYGIGFYGWPVLQRDLRTIPFITPLCKSAGRSGTFFSHRINSFSWIRSFMQGSATCLYLGLSIASVVCFGLPYT